jgi:hypothetical protein
MFGVQSMTAGPHDGSDLAPRNQARLAKSTLPDKIFLKSTQVATVKILLVSLPVAAPRLLCTDKLSAKIYPVHSGQGAAALQIEN